MVLKKKTNSSRGYLSVLTCLFLFILVVWVSHLSELDWVLSWFLNQCCKRNETNFF